jgi:hypothetical protein
VASARLTAPFPRVQKAKADKQNMEELVTVSDPRPLQPFGPDAEGSVSLTPQGMATRNEVSGRGGVALGWRGLGTGEGALASHAHPGGLVVVVFSCLEGARCDWVVHTEAVPTAVAAESQGVDV